MNSKRTAKQQAPTVEQLEARYSELVGRIGWANASFDSYEMNAVDLGYEIGSAAFYAEILSEAANDGVI
jgi:hypothetical protein